MSGKLIELRRKQQRAEETAKTDRYMRCYSDMLNAMSHLRDMAIAGATIKQIQSAINETLIVDEATWQLMVSGEKALRKEHTKQRAALRSRSVSS